MESNKEFKIDSIVTEVVAEFTSRASKGFAKYGTDMDRKDLSPSEWCQHLREELMDSLVYITRLKKDLEKLEAIKTSGTQIAYNTTLKPNKIYTEKEDVVMNRYGWHR